MFSCVTITPLGSIVEPDVYCRNKIFAVSTNGTSETARRNFSVTIHGRPEM